MIWRDSKGNRPLEVMDIRLIGIMLISQIFSSTRAKAGRNFKGWLRSWNFLYQFRQFQSQGFFWLNYWVFSGVCSHRLGCLIQKTFLQSSPQLLWSHCLGYQESQHKTEVWNERAPGVAPGHLSPRSSPRTSGAKTSSWLGIFVINLQMQLKCPWVALDSFDWKVLPLIFYSRL